MVYIQQGSLCTLKKQIGSRYMGSIQFARYICNHGTKQFRMLHSLVEDCIELHFSVNQIGGQRITKNKRAGV